MINTNSIINYEFFNEFKKQKLEERIKISDKILLKYSDRVPILIDCKKDINLNKNKYIVPRNLSVAQFVYIIKKKIKMNGEQSIYLLCNNKLIMNTEEISILYENNKDYDGFLYIILTLENTFGN